MEFSHELAFSLLKSNNSFPVDFDEAWKWIGYSTKQKAKNKLFKNFLSDIDYTLNRLGKRVKGNLGEGSTQYAPSNFTISKCLQLIAPPWRDGAGLFFDSVLRE